MVFVNLTWQSASFFSSSLFLAAFFLGGMINPRLTYGPGNQDRLCLVCPEREEGTDMFFKNGAAFVYHMICFMHFGGMGAGIVGLVFSLFVSGGKRDANVDYLKYVVAFGLPIAWVLSWAIQLIVLATAHKWQGYHWKDAAPNILLWWFVFGGSVLMVILLVVVSSYGLVHETYVNDVYTAPS